MNARYSCWSIPASPSLLEEDRCYVPAYLGAYGWIGVDLANDTDWGEADELLDASYRRTAGSRRTAALDSRRPPIMTPPSFAMAAMRHAMARSLGPPDTRV
jgi:hypothetical protein